MLTQSNAAEYRVKQKEQHWSEAMAQLAEQTLLISDGLGSLFALESKFKIKRTQNRNVLCCR